MEGGACLVLDRLPLDLVFGTRFLHGAASWRNRAEIAGVSKARGRASSPKRSGCEKWRLAAVPAMRLPQPLQDQPEP